LINDYTLCRIFNTRKARIILLCSVKEVECGLGGHIIVFYGIAITNSAVEIGRSFLIKLYDLPDTEFTGLPFIAVTAPVLRAMADVVSEPAHLSWASPSTMRALCGFTLNI